MPSQTFAGTEPTPKSLGNASGQAVGRILLQVTAYTSGSIIPIGRVLGATPTVQLPYTNRNTGSAVAAGTAINALGLYEIDATGVEVLLTLAAFIGSISWVPLEG